MRSNPSVFALLCVFTATHINDRKKVTSAARFYDFHDTSGALLSDAVGYPKLFRPRSYFPGTGGCDNFAFGVNG